MYFSDNHIKNRSHLQAFCSSMAIRTTRESDNKIKPAESLYGSHAMAKVFLEMLAEVPQIEKRTFWRLRDSRKSKRECFGACGSSANQKENALALAGLPQIKKRTFWRLRKFRKSKRERFGACGSSASTVFFILMYAEGRMFFVRRLQGAASAYLLIIDVFAFIVGKDFLPVRHRFVFLNKGARRVRPRRGV